MGARPNFVANGKWMEEFYISGYPGLVEYFGWTWQDDDEDTI